MPEPERQFTLRPSSDADIDNDEVITAGDDGDDVEVSESKPHDEIDRAARVVRSALNGLVHKEFSDPLKMTDTGRIVPANYTDDAERKFNRAVSNALDKLPELVAQALKDLGIYVTAEATLDKMESIEPDELPDDIEESNSIRARHGEYQFDYDDTTLCDELLYRIITDPETGHTEYINPADKPSKSFFDEAALSRAMRTLVEEFGDSKE